jgi:hypothetical protein
MGWGGAVVAAAALPRLFKTGVCCCWRLLVGLVSIFAPPLSFWGRGRKRNPNFPNVLRMPDRSLRFRYIALPGLVEWFVYKGMVAMIAKHTENGKYNATTEERAGEQVEIARKARKLILDFKILLAPAKMAS